MLSLYLFLFIQIPCWAFFITILLSQCPSGILIHPFGIEQSLHDCINSLRQCYGDKQGKQFRVWVDQVLFSQTGSDSWLVNFKKWEQSGEPLSLFWSTLCSLSLRRSLFILNPVWRCWIPTYSNTRGVQWGHLTFSIQIWYYDKALILWELQHSARCNRIVYDYIHVWVSVWWVYVTLSISLNF